MDDSVLYSNNTKARAKFAVALINKKPVCNRFRFCKNGRADDNSLTTKTADNNFFVCKFSKKSKLYHVENSKTSVHLDEVVHYEPRHQELRLLQIQLQELMSKKLNENCFDL